MVSISERVEGVVTEIIGNGYDVPIDFLSHIVGLAMAVATQEAYEDAARIAQEQAEPFYSRDNFDGAGQGEMVANYIAGEIRQRAKEMVK